MKRSTEWGGRHPKGFSVDEMPDIPLIPAPVAFFTLVLGLMIGIMIGRKKAMMQCGGMGMGSMGGMHGGNDWMTRKKMMMGGMGMHHHHGSGMPECKCGDAGVDAPEDDQPGTGG